MMKPQVRLFIFAGRFGSGKTEASVNFAVQLAQGGRGESQSGQFNSHAVLVDLDIVTPYFRTRELADVLIQSNVRVVAPSIAGRFLDMPAVSPEILGAIERRDERVVLDVGGDPQGARALGQYSPYITSQPYEAYFLVNPFRPFTDTVEGIKKAIGQIEHTSRLRMTALASNPNLMDETTPELILSGHQRVMEASEAVGLPVAMLCVEQSLVSHIRPHVGDLPVLPIKRFFDLGWAR